MKTLAQFAVAICGLLAMVGSTAVAQTIASSYSWTSTGPIISAKSDATHNVIAVKDPSAVFYNGQWIVYASYVNSAGGYGMEYLNIGPSWSNASSATPYFMDNTPGFSGYHTAPQVFFFAPQNKWYLIFQSGQPQYSTNSDPTKPQNWTAPKNFYASMPASVSAWIDFWVICDSQNCYLFFTGDNGNFYRASTPINQFPNGFNEPVIVDSSSQFNMFEADNVYSVEGTGEYLANIECLGPQGQRFFRALWASSLGGTWQSLGNTDNFGTPFLGQDDVTFQSGVSAWTTSFSSGGLLIDGDDQTDSVNPKNLQFLYQGANPTAYASDSYNAIPWQLGLATSKANTVSSGPVDIDAGGSASGSWVADEDVSGGTALTYTNAVSTSSLSGTVPPAAVLQSQRYGNSSSFTYTIPGFTSGSSHTVTLYFVENFVTATGQREFNVLINGSQVLTNFDVFATAGGQFNAIQRSFTTTANSSGQVVIQFNPGAIQNPMVSGIAIQ